MKIIFLHDVVAFALGEISYGQERGHRIIHLCIGTGAGTAFSVNGELVTQGEGVPENGWIYNMAFKDSMIDDYISARGLTAIAKEYYGDEIDGKTLFTKAIKQDEKALLTFERFGRNLFEAFTPFIKAFHADCIILGGEITKSFKFFGALTENFCIAEKVNILLTHNTSKSILLGLYKKLKSGE